MRNFEANGGGVALNDLDRDGDLDIVLANHADPNTILWNEGDLTFRAQPLGEGDSRAVAIVDVDGDGWLDIVFTRRVSAPNYWRNEGDPTFSRTVLPNVDKPLYSMNWADLDGDTDLDFVGGTHDAGLLDEFGTEFLASDKAGVFVYLNEAGRYQMRRLADLNGDGRLDIVVGNDFGVPDFAWLQTDGGWQPYNLSTMTHSTMSYASGDINNNGQFELFATDMKPYADDPTTQAAWQPIMAAMMSDPHPPDDPQIMENVLHMANHQGDWLNGATERGIEATGWSWSAKFGDLDQDGFLDLYVVNGFIEQGTFGHLPNGELVEENQVFRNEGAGMFVPMPAWGLNATASGRGMSMADLDNDGDLDIVVNNLLTPAQLFENRLCGGQSVQVELRWPESGNSHAVGATVSLHTADGQQQHRRVETVSGYLSGDPSRLHFGLPHATTPARLDIRWPDGKVSHIIGLTAGTTLIVSRVGS